MNAINLQRQFQTYVQHQRDSAREAGQQLFETPLGNGSPDVDTQAKYFAITDGLQSMRAEAARLKALDGTGADKDPAPNAASDGNSQASFDAQSGELTSFQSTRADGTQSYERLNGVMSYTCAGPRGGLGLVCDDNYQAILFSRYA